MLERADTAEAIGLNQSRLRSTRPYAQTARSLLPTQGSPARKGLAQAHEKRIQPRANHFQLRLIMNLRKALGLTWQSQAGGALEPDDMVKTKRTLVSIVTPKQAKEADRLEPKGKQPGSGPPEWPDADSRAAGVQSEPKSSGELGRTWKRCQPRPASRPGRPYRKAGQGAQHWEDRKSQGQR